MTRLNAQSRAGVKTRPYWHSMLSISVQADPQHASISKHISEITKVINIMQQTIKL